MVDYRQLFDADPDAVNRSAPAWRRLGDTARGCADGLEAQQRVLLADWSGEAADVAQRRLSRLRDALLAAGPVLAGAATAVEELADGIRDVQRGLVEAALRADGDPVVIADDGTVRLDWHGQSPDPYGAAIAEDVRSRVRTALADARRLDVRAASALRELALVPVGGGPTGSPVVGVPDDVRPISTVTLAAPPAPGAGADTVAAWWHGLTPDDRRWLLAHQPGWLGGLDGVPARVRDTANRTVWAHERDALLARRERALAAAPAAGWSTELGRVDGMLAGLEAIGARLDRPDGPRALLLGLDTSTRGHAIVAVGDPDRADHVLTYVPGVGGRLATLGGLIGDADRLQRAAADANRDAAVPGRPGPAASGAAPAGNSGERCSVIVWLGYDPPARVTDATTDGPARDGAPALRRFLDGLRAAREGPPAHRTVVGHSYGSTVAGWAARQDGLAVDDLVLLGSPGAGAARASELAGATRVWASTATHDPITAAYSPAGVVAQVAGGPLRTLGGPIGQRAAEPDGDLLLGADPTGAAFGARVFASTPGSALHPLRAHLSYLARGGRSLHAVAAIAVGRTPEGWSG